MFIGSQITASPTHSMAKLKAGFNQIASRTTVVESRPGPRDDRRSTPPGDASRIRGGIPAVKYKSVFCLTLNTGNSGQGEVLRWTRRETFMLLLLIALTRSTYMTRPAS